MVKYYHIKKSDVPYILNRISETQTKNGTFYNVAVLPYTGKKYDPSRYSTIKIG